MTVSRSDRRTLLGLYAGSALAFYLFTWWTYGGLAGGHPPIYDIEEFVSAAGLKFGLYFLLTTVIFHLLASVPRPKRARVFITWHLLALTLFAIAAHYGQSVLLEAFGWVQFFGGRLAPLNDVLTVVFYVVQLTLLLILRMHPTTAPADASPPPTVSRSDVETVLGRKGQIEVPLRWRDIAYLQAFGNYTRAHAGGATYLLGFGIGAAAERVPRQGYVRIHRSYLINLDHLSCIRREGRNYRADLLCGTSLPIGRKYLPTIKDWRR